MRGRTFTPVDLHEKLPEFALLDMQSTAQKPKSKFPGQVFTAMVTPFKRSGSLDEEGVERVVDHLFENGSDGIVVCGTTGESPTLTHEEKEQLFRIVKEAVGDRGTVIAGSGNYSTA